VSASAALGDLARARCPDAVLLGPDEESEQWVAQAAGARSRWQIARKLRRGDTEVEVTLPDPEGLHGQEVVIVDDILSSGRTVARCAEAALRAGAARVSCAVTHGLFAGDALEHVLAAGVSQIWCADAVPHPLNALPLAPLLAQALRGALSV
jgi:ribose-phosphate pyrophosphokinase